MKFFKWLFIVAIVVGAVFVSGSFFLPATLHVERSAMIKAEPATIFPYLNSYRRFNEWSPWFPRDPGAKYDYSGAEAGVGAQMSWDSTNPEVGSGSQKIVESVDNEKVVTALDFGEMGVANARFLLNREEGATRVTWMFDTELPADPVSRWMGILIKSAVGADYEEGLGRLKEKVETTASNS